MFNRFDRNAKRVGEILAILGRYGLADWLSGLNYEWLQGRLVSFDGERLGKLTQEARIRLALTELGTTFIKFGQMLSHSRRPRRARAWPANCRSSARTRLPIRRKRSRR